MRRKYKEKWKMESIILYNHEYIERERVLVVILSSSFFFVSQGQFISSYNIIERYSQAWPL